MSWQNKNQNYGTTQTLVNARHLRFFLPLPFYFCCFTIHIVLSDAVFMTTITLFFCDIWFTESSDLNCSNAPKHSIFHDKHTKTICLHTLFKDKHM